jgi:hypothetical protein
MKIGIIISSNDAETCWNALRYANFAIGQKDEVKVFFMGKGVEYQKVSTDKFNTVEQADKLLKVRCKDLCLRDMYQKQGAGKYRDVSDFYNEGYVRILSKKAIRS